MKMLMLALAMFSLSLFADDKDFELYNSVLTPEEELGSCPGGNCRNLRHVHNPALDPDIPN
ncbi:MAG: hypothetical protein ACK4HV_08590 [Parachlamydiaceae bacterium]